MPKENSSARAAIRIDACFHHGLVVSAAVIWSASISRFIMAS